MNGLDGLNRLVSVDYSVTPTDYESVLFFFFEQGVDFNSFCDLPLPYIFSMLKTKRYVNKLNESSIKK